MSLWLDRVRRRGATAALSIAGLVLNSPWLELQVSGAARRAIAPVIAIEGDPESPISRGRLCPKGAASEQLANAPNRVTTVRYRRPFAAEWEDLDLATATDMIADRFVAARHDYWQAEDPDGRRVDRTLGIASLGGATLDVEENYLIKKLFTAAGAIQIENQARI